jgi:hypothetical protein
LSALVKGVVVRLFFVPMLIVEYFARSNTDTFINPILHTVWLDSHALTLKNYTAKYYEVRKIWFLAYLANFLSSIEENCIHVHILFNW